MLIQHIDLKKKIKWLQNNGYREHLNRKGTRNRKRTELEKRGNRTKSKIRSRIEHVFGIQAQRAGNMILRGVGFMRAAAKIVLRNLTFNIDRYGELLIRIGVPQVYRQPVDFIQLAI